LNHRHINIFKESHLQFWIQKVFFLQNRKFLFLLFLRFYY